MTDLSYLSSAGDKRQHRGYAQRDCVPHPLPPNSRDQAIASMYAFAFRELK